MKKRFEDIMEIWATVFDDSRGACRAWQKVEGQWKKSISIPMWDAEYVAFSELLTKYPQKNLYTRCKSDLQRAIQQVFENGELELSKSTNSARITRKNLFFNTFDAILGQSSNVSGPRQFADRNHLRQTLFDTQNGRCGICSQTLDPMRILDGSYAELDHIHPHSRGGSSDAHNAQLTHKECNRVKGAKLMGSPPNT